MTGYGGVILKTVAPANGIDVSKSDFAKESEVLLPAGTYQVSIVRELKPFHRQFKKIEDFSEVFSKLKKASKSDADKELLLQVNHLMAVWKDKLSEEQADLLFSFYSAKYLKMAAETPNKFCNINIEDEYFKKGKKLNIEIRVPFSIDLLPLCSAKIHKQVNKAAKQIAVEFEKEIRKLDDVDLSTINKYDISGILEFKKLFNLEQYIRPFKIKLANEYNRLNSREMNKTLNDVHKIEDHGKRIQNLITAMGQL